MIPCAVLLSMQSGVEDWGWFIPTNVCQIGNSSYALMNSSAVCTSTANTITFLITFANK